MLLGLVVAWLDPERMGHLYAVRAALDALAARLKAGNVRINAAVAPDFAMPFGGMKHSGIGRESGMDAIHEYLETKSVWISTAEGSPANPFVMR